jgi:hypothetical protein
VPDAERAIVPGTGHEISAPVIDVTVEYLERHPVR